MKARVFDPIRFKTKKTRKTWGYSAMFRYCQVTWELFQNNTTRWQTLQSEKKKKKKKKNMLPFGGRCLKTRSLGGYPEPSQFSWFSEKWNVFNWIVTPFIFTEPWKFGKRVPSWQLTYPHSRYIWVDDLPFERWDMLVPWEGTPLTALSTLYTPEV